MTGNGYCTNSDNGDGVARRYYSGMSHEEARNICEEEATCIAYTYSLDYFHFLELDFHNILNIFYLSKRYMTLL